MTRCAHMNADATPAGILAICPAGDCRAVQLDDDRWQLDVRWTLLRDPDAAPLRHDRAVTAADARWQQAGRTEWVCERCGGTALGSGRAPPVPERWCKCKEGEHG